MHKVVEAAPELSRGLIASRAILLLRGVRGTAGVPWTGARILENLEDFTHDFPKFAQSLWASFQEEPFPVNNPFRLFLFPRPGHYFIDDGGYSTFRFYV
jgi:hypothetical protein